MPQRIEFASGRSAGRLGGVEATLQDTDLMPRIAELGSQAVGFGPMTLIALLRPTQCGIQLLLQSRGCRALPIDFEEGALLGRLQALLQALRSFSSPSVKSAPGLRQRRVALAIFTLQARDVGFECATGSLAAETDKASASSERYVAGTGERLSV
ncbi:hypothetical protein [Burkholderia ubonensis]|uniref:hypothetical protein n=1 Tax=Burkholderia ubonensis TaxID=101571 RepID=UPI00075A43FF|nr:hypothetical protein [Burkholderia ubonensis]KVL65442.1 hypothetical protein WJ48_01620 [Burkholderia ubonensis]KVL76354.1 hypothetical protein WJ49_11680 [Burkholderia ubonensis]KVL92099.1 hypothetical protein WJ50_10825 [Burkholderia ubonensis]